MNNTAPAGVQDESSEDGLARVKALAEIERRSRVMDESQRPKRPPKPGHG